MYIAAESNERSFLKYPLDWIYVLLQRLMDCGFSRSHMNRLHEDGRFRSLAAKFCEDGGITSLPEAEAGLDQLLGRNGYFGIRDWSRYFWAILEDSFLDSFPAFPWPLELLDQPCIFYPEKKIRETHVAFLGLSHLAFQGILRLSTWEAVFNDTKISLRNAQGEKLRFFNRLPADLDEPLPVWESDYRWYLILLGKVPGCEGKSFKEQAAMLPPEYEVPRLVTEVQHKVLYVVKTGEINERQPGHEGLDCSHSFRCSDQFSWGSYDKGDLNFCVRTEVGPAITVGVTKSAAEKPNEDVIHASRIPGR